MVYDSTFERDEFRYDQRDLRDDRRNRDRLESMMMDAMRQIERESRPIDRPERPDAVMEVINNPTITMTPAQKKAVNDPKKMMNSQGTIVRTPKRASGQDVIRSSGQFSSMMIPNLPEKRTRKKTKMDKTMSRCLKEANSKLRLKNGRLRKGKTMSDVMKMAHRLCKKS